MRLSARLDRLVRRLPALAKIAPTEAEVAWCKRHGLDPEETLVAIVGGTGILILGGTQEETNALLADWPGGRVVVLPPLVDE